MTAVLVPLKCAPASRPERARSQLGSELLLEWPRFDRLARAAVRLVIEEVITTARLRAVASAVKSWELRLFTAFARELAALARLAWRQSIIIEGPVVPRLEAAIRASLVQVAPRSLQVAVEEPIKRVAERVPG